MTNSLISFINETLEADAFYSESYGERSVIIKNEGVLEEVKNIFRDAGYSIKGEAEDYNICIF